MTPEEKQELIDFFNSNDQAAEQVWKILRALTVAKLRGRVVISPESEDAPVVLISFEKDTKDAITKQLAQHGVKPSWDKEGG